jgi:hypothetical protein
MRLAVRKLFKKSDQVFGFRTIALAKLLVVLIPGTFRRLINKQFADHLKDFTACPHCRYAACYAYLGNNYAALCNIQQL